MTPAQRAARKAQQERRRQLWAAIQSADVPGVHAGLAFMRDDTASGADPMAMCDPAKAETRRMLLVQRDKANAGLNVCDKYAAADGIFEAGDQRKETK